MKMSIKIDMTPAVLDLVLYAGDVGDFKITFKDTDDTALDVSTYGLQAQIRKARASEEYVNLDLDVTNAATGIVIVKISEDVTRDLAVNKWDKTAQWDLQATEPSVVTLLQGSVTCKMDVTRVNVTSP
jgi:hypothetical protein